MDTRSPWDKNENGLLVIEKDENLKGVYYIKEVKGELYVKFDEPPLFGYSKVIGSGKRDARCRIEFKLVQ